MSRDVLRYSRWIGLALLLTLILASGCTRAKSSGPPTATAIGGAEAVTGTPGAVSTTTPLSGQDVIAATGAAMETEIAATAIGTAEATGTPSTATAAPTRTPAMAAASPTPLPPAALQPTALPLPMPTALPSGQVSVHVVQPGENLFRIALKYGLSYQRLAAFNGITNPHVIRVGQEIKIPGTGEPGITPVPGERYHIVKPGENLFRIALSYGMSYEQLAAVNGLRYPYIIYVGQRLIIP